MYYIHIYLYAVDIAKYIQKSKTKFGICDTCVIKCKYLISKRNNTQVVNILILLRINTL